MAAGTLTGKKCGCPVLLLFKLLLQIVVAASSKIQLSSFVGFQPDHLHKLPEGQNQAVSVAIRVPPEHFSQIAPDEKWNLSVSSYHPDVATSDTQFQLEKSDFKFDNATQFYRVDKPIIVVGHKLGKTGMRVRLVPAKDWLETDNQSTFLAENNYNENSPLYRRFDESEKLLDVWILRSDESKLLTGLFVASIGILMSIANVMMGCELDLATIWKTIKRPVAPAIGLFTQFILMPLLSYIIAVTIFTPRGLYSMALGIFVTGCAPAGGASNFWTLLLDGNVSLSITMTFISTCASLVMMPLWIHLLAGPFLQGFSRDSRIKIPYRNIIGTIAFLVVPLLIGVGIQKWKPNWAANARKIMRPFVIFVLIFVVVFGSLTQLYMFRMMNFPAIIGGLLLPWCGFMFGCFTAIITRREPPDVTAIAIETGIQNTGIAILLLKASFAQPDADIGMVLPVIVACFTPFPLLFGAAVHHTIKYIKKKRQGSVDVEKPAMILEKTEDKQTTLLLKDSDNLTPPGLSSPILKDSKTSMTTMLTTTSGIGTSTTGSQESTDKY